MGRGFFQWPGFAVAIGLAFLPSAHAGERKSENGLAYVKAATLQGSVIKASFATTTAFGDRKTDGGNAATRKDEPRDSGQTARPQHKTLTFFRLNPKLGDVSVQPVVGGVNGAQLSIGF